MKNLFILLFAFLLLITSCAAPLPEEPEMCPGILSLSIGKTTDYTDQFENIRLVNVFASHERGVDPMDLPTNPTSFTDFNSSDSAIITVDEAGLLTPIAEGEALLTFQSDGKLYGQQIRVVSSSATSSP